MYVSILFAYSSIARCKSTYLVNGPDIRGQAAVHAKDLAVDDGGEIQTVKHLRAVLPWVRVAVLPDALVVETVHLCDLPRLVVAAEERDVCRVSGCVRARVLCT